MSEKNYLPESGTIDLNKPEEQALQVTEPKEITVAAEAQENRPVVDTTPVQITETTTEKSQTKQETKAEPIGQGNNVIPPDSGADETGKMNPKILAIVAIVAGILIISAGFVAYRYFNREDSSDFVSAPVAEVEIENENNEDYSGIIDDLNGRITSGVSTSRAEDWETPGDSTGIVKENTETESNEIAQQPQPTAGQGSGTPESVFQGERSNNSDSQTGITTQPTNANTAWVANDYEFGDIPNGSYTVERGDTLWEISEAVYGDGSSWHKLADANNVSYLSNGNPLIVPGQTLNIPI